MEDLIKKSIDRALHELGELREKMDDLVEDAPEELEEFRESMDKSFDRMGKRLQQSAEQGRKLTEEAELQAHLGLMEAKEQLEASKKVVEAYTSRVLEHSDQMLDELELKAALGKMEAEEFWEERGPELKREFESSRDALFNMAGQAAQELQEQFNKWNALLSEKGSKKS